MGWHPTHPRALALLLAAALLLSLVACGGGDPSSGGSDSGENSASEPAPSGDSSLESGVSQSPSSEESSDPGAALGSSVEAATPETPSGAGPDHAPQPEEDAPEKEAVSYVLTPYAGGTTVYGNEYVEIDASNLSEGYVCIRYIGGGGSRIKVLINQSGSATTYQYDLNLKGNYEVFSFSQGGGDYDVKVYQNVGGNSYALLYGVTLTVSLRGSMLPFLYPNQYVNFWNGSTTVAVGADLARTAENDLGIVSNVYNYVIDHIDYDFNKANNAAAGNLPGYLPQPDSILETGLGICFDYAAVMTTMLRTQQIPTKLVVGYSGNIYHAWISTYITDVGWINGVIYFDGQSWKLMDPTFADNGDQSDSIMQYINNSANYSPIYYY